MLLDLFSTNISAKFGAKKFFIYKFVILLLFCFSLIVRTEALQSNASIHKFISCINGQEDYYALIPGKNNTLIVYLHSLSGDFNEPFKSDAEFCLATSLLKEYPAASFLSFNYGISPSWGSPAARIDITNGLRSVISQLNIKRIIFVGVSMGASTALTYAATAPADIKSKIVGIVAVSPCANLEDLYKQTGSPEIKASLEGILGAGTQSPLIAYQQNSLDTCVAFLPTTIKVGIISATEDKSVPIELQKDVARDLNNRNINVKSYEIEGKFSSLPIKSILEASHFVIQ